MDPNESLRYLNIGLPDTIRQMKLCGRFDDALRAIDNSLAEPALPFSLRRRLEAERHIIERLPGNYPYTQARALAILQKYLPGFTAQDLKARMDRGLIRWIYVNGEKRLICSFDDTLLKCDPVFLTTAAGRAGAAGFKTNFDLIERSVEKMRVAGSHSVRIRIRAAIRLKERAFRRGMFLRVHLPIPAACKQQSNIVIERMYPENGMVAPEDAPQRTVFWEKIMEDNHGFFVEYSYICTAEYRESEHLTCPPQEHDFSLEEEEPHIVFTPAVCSLAKSLTAGVTDPLEKARRFYDYITTTMHYSFEPPYVLLECIADQLAQGGYGDCGMFSILFIALCRYVGIPARWQSGLTALSEKCGKHDWAQFYVEPYGWLSVDCAYGIEAHAAQNEPLRKFYFGNLDPYRMVANRCFQAGFTVPKRQWRDDPYDNQIGEMESTDRAFYHRTDIRVTARVISVEEL